MTYFKARRVLANLLEADADTHSTMEGVLDKPTRQALHLACSALGSMWQQHRRGNQRRRRSDRQIERAA